MQPNLHDFPTRVGTAQGVCDLRIFGDTVRRSDNRTIGDIEVNVGAAKRVGIRRRCIPGGLGDRNQLEPAPARIGFGLQDPAVLGHDCMARIGGIRDSLHQHASGAGQGDVAIDVAVGFGIGDVAGQPDDLFYAQHRTQLGIGIGACPARVAVGIEHAGVRRDQRPLPIREETATLDDEVGAKRRCAGECADPKADCGVAIVRVVLTAPGIEAKHSGRTPPLLIQDKGWPGVTQP